MSKLAQFAVGYLYTKVVENLAHKYLLHNLGKKKESFWSFHFHDHHKAAIKYGMLDPAYFEQWWLNSLRAKEVGSLVATFGMHLPLVKKHPYFVAGVGIGVLEYYYKHKKSHTEPEWAWEYMQNHVKHHLLEQNNYWGVTSGLVDRIAGTAPKVSDEEWIELRIFYMRRYNEVREKVTELAKKRYKEHKEKFEESLENLADTLYSFLGRK